MVCERVYALWCAVCVHVREFEICCPEVCARVPSQLITVSEGAHWPAPDCQWLKQPGIVGISCLKVSQVCSKGPGEQWNPGIGGESLPSEQSDAQAFLYPLLEAEEFSDN